MADMQALIRLALPVIEEPSEEHLEAFLQAYNASQPPENKVELVLFEFLGDMMVTEYMDPPCTCGKHKEQNDGY